MKYPTYKTSPSEDATNGPWSDAHLFALTRDTRFWTRPIAEDWCDIRPHLLTLYTLAKWIRWRNPTHPGPDRPPVCLEIGVRHGISTIAILHAMRETNGRLISVEIDPHWAKVATERIEAAGLSPWWELHVSSSDDYANDCPKNLDLVWIDGDHRYHQVCRDFYNYAPRARPDGVVCMHDYYQDLACTSRGEVASLVDQVESEKQWRVLTLPFSHGLTILRPE